jgi:hypothetical protein
MMQYPSKFSFYPPSSFSGRKAEGSNFGEDLKFGVINLSLLFLVLI